MPSALRYFRLLLFKHRTSYRFITPLNRRRLLEKTMFKPSIRELSGRAAGTLTSSIRFRPPLTHDRLGALNAFPALFSPDQAKFPAI
jgi:hypothetical protein